MKPLLLILFFPLLVAAQTITVTPGTSHQTMNGWEFTAQAGQNIYPSNWPFYKDNLADIAVADGLTRIRMGVDHRDENTVPGRPMSAVNDNADPFVINDAGFQWANNHGVDSEAEIINLFRSRLAALGETFYVVLSYGDAVTVAFEQNSNPEEYAELIEATFLHLNSTQGWVPDAVEIINEPDANANPEWTATMIANCLLATRSRLASHGWTPRFIIPSVQRCYDATTWYNNIKSASGSVIQYVDELTYHYYDACSGAALNTMQGTAEADGNRIAMMEWIGADYLRLHDDLKHNAVAWQQFTLAGDLASADDGGKYYLVNLSTNAITLGSRTKLLRQYFKWIRRGAVRKGTSTSNSNFDGLAFQNTGGNYTVVINALTNGSGTIVGLPAGVYHKHYTTGAAYNIDGGDQTITTGQSVTFSIPAAGAFTVHADAPALPSSWYASPSGSGSTCSLASPCTLATAITKPVAGDTVYLRAGTYPKVRLIKNGTLSQPITYRNYPGERATIDSPIWGNQDSIDAPVWLEGSYQIVMGLEIMNSNTTRTGAVGVDGRPAGIQIDGIGDMAINNVIHDCGNGMFALAPSKGAYGNVVYNNGWDAVGGQGPTGHAIYAQHDDVNNPKLIQENLFVNSYGYGIHAYTGSNPNALNGFTLTGNIIANSGAGGQASRENILIGGNSAPAKAVTATFNYSWNRGVQLHYNYTDNFDLVFTDNVLGRSKMELYYWRTATVRRNKLFASGLGIILADDTHKTSPWDWDANSWYNDTSTQAFGYTASPGFLTFAQFKTASGWDTNSTFTNAAPTGTDVFVRPNSYEVGRANIAIFNWDSASSVNVNLSTVGLTNGQGYEFRAAENYFGTPVLTGTYSSASPSVSVPMNGTTVTMPIGSPGSFTPATTRPQFGAFVVLPTTAVQAAGQTQIKGKLTLSGQMRIQ